MQHELYFQKVFSGSEWLFNQDVVIQDGLIKSVRPSEKNLFVNDDAYSFVAPAFIDFQVYGASGKLFSAFPAPGTLQTMYEVFSAEGTCLFQPTLATNTVSVFKKAIDAVRAYWKGGGKGVHGLHLEGPWLNPSKRGAHIEALIHPPVIEEVSDILDYGKEVIKTITLAPEVCSDEVISLILSYDIVLSAGHSNATFQQAMQGIDKGISAITHLYNAMSPLHHREPGLVGASLQHDEVRASIIPDGYHVDFEAIRIAKKLLGERLFAITDAVTETSTGPYQHYQVGNKYECNGTLSGSALSMKDAFANLVYKVGIPVEEALRMCALYPARALGIEYLYGKIAPGFAAQFVVFDKQLKLVKVIT